jgi:hypothetical protein
VSAAFSHDCKLRIFGGLRRETLTRLCFAVESIAAAGDTPAQLALVRLRGDEIDAAMRPLGAA